MKKPLRRRRFFSLDERTPAAYLQNQRQSARAAQAEQKPADEFIGDEENFEDAVDPAELQNSEGQAGDGDLPSGFALSRVPKPRAKRRRRLAAQRAAWIAFTFLTIGAVAGYFWGKRVQAQEPRPKLVGEVVKIKPLTDEDQERLEAAYEARHQRHYDEAVRQFAALSQEHPEWQWLGIEGDRTRLFKGEISEARRSLSEMADKNVQSAEANYLLAVAYMAEKDYPRAESFFATSVAHDPTRPEYYYLWGECLRNAGKSLEASGKFQAALRRNTFEVNDSVYRLKFWLCQIDADQEKTSGLGAYLDAEMSRQHPSVSVLFAVAAREIKARNFKAAAAHLQQARTVADPAMFQILLDDPIFRQAKTQPGLSELFWLGKDGEEASSNK